MALEKSNSKIYVNLHMKSEYLTYEVHELIYARCKDENIVQ